MPSWDKDIKEFLERDSKLFKQDLITFVDTAYLLAYCKTDKEEMVMILAERKGDDLFVHLSEKYRDEEKMDKDIETLSRLYKVEPKHFK